MAESSPSTSSSRESVPQPKRAKRSLPVTKVNAEARSKKFDDLYADGEVLFCKYCCHSVDFVRVQTVKDHLKLKKDLANKETRSGKERQVTLMSVEKSKSLIVNTLKNSTLSQKLYLITIICLLSVMITIITFY